MGQNLTHYFGELCHFVPKNLGSMKPVSKWCLKSVDKTLELSLMAVRRGCMSLHGRTEVPVSFEIVNTPWRVLSRYLGRTLSNTAVW